MRYIIYSCSLFLFLLVSCFEDNGNYSYENLNGPIWLINVNTSNIRMTCYEGGMAKFQGHKYFKWDKDSIEREANVRYEWKLRDVVIGEKADFEMPTDSLIKMIKVPPFSEDGLMGSFSIIDKTSGITFLAKVFFLINARYSKGDWLILSADGDHSKCSFVKRKSRANGDETEIYYELSDNIFKTINGMDIPGKPLNLAKAIAKDVGSLGSTTIMTDQVSYVINNENLVKISELKDEFLDGTPRDFNVVDRRDCDNYTFLTTKDGRIFRRILSTNFLGGKFLSDPYMIDNRGSRIVKFGHSASNVTDVPCYDEKNRRVVIISFGYEYTSDGNELITNHIVPVVKGKGNMDNLPPVWEMPEGTNVLYLTQTIYASVKHGAMYTIFYNDKNDNTYMADFGVSYIGSMCLETSGVKIEPFPGSNLTKESLFLTSVFDWGPLSTIIYTKGNEVRYIDRNRDNEDNPFLKFNAKVTYIGYTTYYSADEYTKFVVGLEDGSLLFYDIKNMRIPRILSQFKLNGKITAARELGNVYGGDAY